MVLRKSTRTAAPGVVLDSLIIIALVLGFSPVFLLYWDHYWDLNTMNGAYSHAPFALLVFLYLVWRERQWLTAVTDPRHAAWQGYLLLCCGVLLKLYGDLQGYVFLRGMALLPILFGLARVKFTREACRALRYPILFLVFVIPLPTFAIDQVTRVLQGVTVDLVVYALAGLGLHIELNGFVLTIIDSGLPSGTHDLIISQNCSGIRYMVVLFALGTLYAHLREFRPWWKVLVLALLVPFSLIGNFLRVLLTALLIVYLDPVSAEAFFHEFSGVVIFGSILISLFFLESLLRFVAGSSMEDPDHAG